MSNLLMLVVRIMWNHYIRDILKAGNVDTLPTRKKCKWVNKCSFLFEHNKFGEEYSEFFLVGYYG